MKIKRSDRSVHTVSAEYGHLEATGAGSKEVFDEILVRHPFKLRRVRLVVTNVSMSWGDWKWHAVEKRYLVETRTVR